MDPQVGYDVLVVGTTAIVMLVSVLAAYRVATLLVAWAFDRAFGRR